MDVLPALVAEGVIDMAGLRRIRRRLTRLVAELPEGVTVTVADHGYEITTAAAEPDVVTITVSRGGGGRLDWEVSR